MYSNKEYKKKPSHLSGACHCNDTTAAFIGGGLADMRVDILEKRMGRVGVIELEKGFAKAGEVRQLSGDGGAAE